MSEALGDADLSRSGLPLFQRGKVRNMYHVDDAHMLVVATDRLSAFDVVLPQPIPGKGEVLARLSGFWKRRTDFIVPNDLCGISVDDVVTDPDERACLGDRAVVVRRLDALPVEAIVRGYLIGSGWKDYQKNGAVCGITLPEGLTQADRLREPIYTPSTKAQTGDHDENISFDRTAWLLGSDLAKQVREVSLRLYQWGAIHALAHGIIIADTKFEFGLDADGRLYLIDEVLTPDSSRFWPESQYQPGTSPPSFDKQFVRDYLETLGWDKTPPGPELPQEIIDKTAEKYREAERRLMVD